MQHSLHPAAALLLPLFAGSLHAQNSLEPVVVTATRFETAAQERPIAAQVITAEEIRNSAATTLGEVLNKIGGVHTRMNLLGIPDSPLDLRGFGVTGDQNTLVLVDGQRISENELASARISSIPLDSIERIEILRGSGAVLYGGGATGGTINIITRSTINTPLSGNVSTRIGSHDLREVRGGVRAGGEMWGLRLNAQHYKTDNYRDNNAAEQNAGSGELRFGNKEGFVALGFNVDSQNTRLPGARSEALLKTDRRGANTPFDHMSTDSRLLTLRGEKRLGEITLALDISDRHKKADMFNDSAWGSTRAKTDVDVTTVSPRLLWSTSFARVDNQLTVGADWSRWSYENDTAATGWMTPLDQEGKQKNRAVYLRNDAYFTATGTRLSIGGRKERVQQTQRETLAGPNNSKETDHLSAYEIAVQQDLSAGFSAYGRIGRSFRVGNIDENRCWFAPCASALKPQRSHDKEIGTNWRGQRSDMRLSLFEMDITNEIHYFAPTFSNINLDPTRHRGLELEGRTWLTDTLDVSARYTRTQARFRKGSYGGVDVSGNDVPLVPKNRLSLNLGWEFLPATRLGLSATYVGNQRYDNDQTNRFRKMPNYTVVDLKLSHDLKRWRFAAGVNNLLDKKFYSYGTTNGTTFNAYPEDRRNAYVSAEYRF
ncbi:TonB-dependent receptor [Azonexus sp.]|uniref:TonB-dependent receptor n=1 Tax=Azonexus sp. TaxID=1872668 RepID=UPI0039E7197E